MLNKLFQMFRGNDGVEVADLSPGEMERVAEIRVEKILLDRELALRADSLMRSI